MKGPIRKSQKKKKRRRRSVRTGDLPYPEPGTWSVKIYGVYTALLKV